MAKTIFILLDACADELARANMGWLEHMAEEGRAARYTVRCQLPALSRPLYETLLTGLRVFEHGMASNLTVRRSRHQSIFSLCRENGLTTAAAAYSWISELYNTTPFSPLSDRIQQEESAAIQNGIFYFEDGYPDSHVLSDAAFLRRTYDPDFLMIHTMAIDASGHQFGGGSKEQSAAALAADTAVSCLLPAWLEEGCSVLITADHGMSACGLHGGNAEDQRKVPLYLFDSRAKKGIFTGKPVSQLVVAPLLCALLGMTPSRAMLPLAENEVKFFD